MACDGLVGDACGAPCVVGIKAQFQMRDVIVSIQQISLRVDHLTSEGG